MATYEQAFEYMLKTAMKHIEQMEYARKQEERYAKGNDYVEALYQHAKNTQNMLFGQAELCKELFGVEVLRTLLDIERKIDE